ncbi:MAG: hypothetical protein VW715_07180 [Rhodospirillales bacterium]|jgi:hypothetical protein
MPTNKGMLAKKSAESAELSDQVAEFLARGGEVKQIEECTAADAIDRYRKPYSIKCKDGTQRMYRPAKHRADLDKLIPKTYGGHRTR